MEERIVWARAEVQYAVFHKGQGHKSLLTLKIHSYKFVWTEQFVTESHFNKLFVTDFTTESIKSSPFHIISILLCITQYSFISSYMYAVRNMPAGMVQDLNSSSEAEVQEKIETEWQSLKKPPVTVHLLEVSHSQHTTHT